MAFRKHQEWNQVSVLLNDTDGDGEPNVTDLCPGTIGGEEVDSAGCSLAQFCTAIDTSTKRGERECKASDHNNNESLTQPRDCAVDRQSGLCEPR